jgi:hypothetical protein
MVWNNLLQELHWAKTSSSLQCSRLQPPQMLRHLKRRLCWVVLQ